MASTSRKGIRGELLSVAADRRDGGHLRGDTREVLSRWNARPESRAIRKSKMKRRSLCEVVSSFEAAFICALLTADVKGKSDSCYLRVCDNFPFR
mmetsp:Transcript_9439/g.22743  ORF Transcript_9439/g.22743 Transcript_9439/m.22743 type:complete len:95 (+) Transcript_9439:2199-2483(+)